MKSIYSILLVVMLITACQTSNPGKQSALVEKFEEHRPQFHLSPATQWMNDPNGMVYYQGEYHMFYQHFPDSNIWGPMHWGHAVSPDMVHWEHLPIALYPDSLGYIFSGSAVIDERNTSGFGSEENPPMVAVFTYHDPKGAEAGRIDFQTQGLAYSLDNGRTWTKYKNNPVLENPGIIDFRDPKVSWNDDLRKWVMILAVKDHVSIYTSSDLKDWNHESDFGKGVGAHGGVWECPDLFQLTDEKTGEKKWVMLVSINPGGPNGGSATQYFVGDFDGEAFTPVDSVVRWMDHGTDNYAGVTWANVPESDGRRLLVGWMNNWQYANVVPTEAWRGALTLPRKLVLEGTILKSVPVRELNTLRKEPLTLDGAGQEWKLRSPLIELDLDVDSSEGDEFQVVFYNDLEDELVMTFSNGLLTIDRSKSGKVNFEKGFGRKHTAAIVNELSKVQIFMDLSSVEVFVNEGATVMTEVFFPKEPLTYLKLKGDTTMVEKIAGYQLESIWNDSEDSKEQRAGL